MSTITQVEKGGLFEISEATLAELKSSKYYNDDLAPTSISERSWTTYSITMLWVGMAICIPSLSPVSYTHLHHLIIRQAGFIPTPFQKFHFSARHKVFPVFIPHPVHDYNTPSNPSFSY